MLQWNTYALGRLEGIIIHCRELRFYQTDRGCRILVLWYKFYRVEGSRENHFGANLLFCIDELKSSGRENLLNSCQFEGRSILEG